MTSDRGAATSFSEVIARNLRERFHLASPVEEPIRHLLQHPGKELRPGLAFAVAEALGDAPPRAVTAVAAAAEIVHLASMIHDDLVDGAATRRGVEALHVAYDPRTAVLAGDYLLAAAYTWLTEDAREASLRALAPALLALAESEILEYRLRGTQPPLETARRIASGKTGALFGWIAEAVCLEAGRNDEAGRWRSWGEQLGLLFQLADDLGDRLGVPEGKDVGLDHASGIPTVLDALLACDRDGQTLSEEVFRLQRLVEAPPSRGARLDELIRQVIERAQKRLKAWNKKKKNGSRQEPESLGRK